MCEAGFLHPATMVGPHEVRLMRQRIASGQEVHLNALKLLSEKTPIVVTTHALVVRGVLGKGPTKGERAGECSARLHPWQHRCHPIECSHPIARQTGR